MSEIAVRDPQKELVARVNGPEFKREVARALPENISADRFVRVATTALMHSPEIADCDSDSIFWALLRCAQDGLLPNGVEAAIAPFNDTRNNRKVATYLPMIGGLRMKLAQFGWSLRTRVVYSADEFSYEYGLEQHLTHRPAPPGTDRGDRIAAYAVASHRDGRKEFTVMSAAEVEKVKALAKTKNVWDKWTDQMWEKSAGHQLADDVPLDPAEKDAIRRLIKAEELALDPGSAATMLYGPSGEEMRVLEQADEPEGLAPEATEADGERQGEGGDEQHGTGGAASENADALPPIDPETKMLADEAGEFVPSNGTYSTTGPKGPQTLAQLAQHDDGKKYLVMLLKRLSEPKDYVDAVWCFCRVYMPDEVAKIEQAKL